MDEAFALRLARIVARRLPVEPRQGPRRIALQRQDRMRDELRLVALVEDLGEGRIEQEGHVVVDDLDDRHLAPALAALDLDVDEPQVRRSLPSRRA